MRTAFSLMLMAICGGCSTVLPHNVAQATKPTSVEIFTGGDDGLTQRLAEAIRSEFKQSGRFTLGVPSSADTLRVTIPTHVGWQDVGGGTRVTYQLRLDRGGRKLVESGGTCWEKELHVCARTVVKAATLAVRR